MANPSPESTFAAQDQNGRGLPCVALDNAMTPVSISGSSAQSAAFGANTNIIRVVSTTNCHIAFGANPTATTNDSYLPANVVEYFIVTPGQKIAFIQNSGSGSGYVAEVY